MQNKLFSTLAILCAVACGLSSAHATTTAPTVLYTFDNQNLTITPTGPTTINVAAGDVFTVSGAWSSFYNHQGDASYVQTYLAGLAPLSGQINLFDPASQGSNPGNYFSSGSGLFSGSFIAPTLAGTYYLGGGFTQDYHFDPGVNAVANGSNQVSYIVNVAQTPEPSSLLLLGTGVLGVAGTVRKRLS